MKTKNLQNHHLGCMNLLVEQDITSLLIWTPTKQRTTHSSLKELPTTTNDNKAWDSSWQNPRSMICVFHTLWVLKKKTTVPRKKRSYFPLYKLVNRDPYNAFLQSPYNWVVFHPLYTLNNKGPFFHCSSDTKPLSRPFS